jgi:hypothetical protein
MKSQVRVLPVQIKAISVHHVGLGGNKAFNKLFLAIFFFGIDHQSHLSIAQSLIEIEFTQVTATSHLTLPSVSIGQCLA